MNFVRLIPPHRGSNKLHLLVGYRRGRWNIVRVMTVVCFWMD
ncbi:hypothetical protein HanXRQr2_Chr15g0685751 [Helianthus annuus]|uniref:Uncharacterized protein n=1 Tax=Helianthus annuus TaxID=4232 RepID=A0A9K3H3W4_HELAN|nr:hypothetical protein HanXRQr2_Chr15g0685751 [Helianthus annuus]KAJ0830644.1 hypothetical protein HanPSC8_Chr15g0657751 [Helianthus annuus]